MAWNFELVAGPCKGRTGGLAWDGSGMLFSAVAEERILRYVPATGKTEVFRNYTGRTNGLAMAKDGSVYGAQEGGRRMVHFRKDGSTGALPDLLDGKHHNQPTDVIVDSKGRVWFADAYNAQVPYGPPVYPMLDHASVLRLEQANDGWRMVVSCGVTDVATGESSKPMIAMSSGTRSPAEASTVRAPRAMRSLAMKIASGRSPSARIARIASAPPSAVKLPSTTLPSGRSHARSASR